MKKKLVIITEYENTANFLFNELSNIFTDNIILKKFSFERNNIVQEIDADLVLIPDGSIFKKVKKHVRDGREIIVINRTLNKEGLNKLMNLDKGTKAMLVNVTSGMALDTISLIYQLGVRHIELTPVFPDMENVPELKVAITPGELKYVPDFVDEVIDIGDRVLDISTIMDIIVKLDLNELLDCKEVRDYFDKIIPVSFGLEKIMGKTNRLESQLDVVLKLLDVGIIGVNSVGIINSINDSAKKILGLFNQEVLGGDAKKLFPEIPFEEVLAKSQPFKEKLIRINGMDIALTINPIINYNTIYGAVAIIKNFSDVEKRQHKLRTQLLNKGHVAKYTFDHIAGSSKTILKCKEIARRMARSNSTILILGETGTGKELFAQAIHNYSHRSKFQFVAVNCAALPESLLESELFGYEKGAFTGARKDGKLGLFELAHKGTLFLDEISEIPLKLQARLLRVLEEREVMRIGGERVINVDVRIIAASNRDLNFLVKEGKFRKDLYYRLNILPLKLPPLRERKEDIPILIEELKRELSTDFSLTTSAEKALIEYNFEGNVRELRNYIEYFANLKKEEIDIDDFPVVLQKIEIDNSLDEDDRSVFEKFKKSAAEKLDNYILVLEELNKRYKKNQRAGRRSIARAAEEKNVFLTEAEIREIFYTLKDFKMVSISRGRGGTKITGLGREILKCLQRDKRV